MPTPNDLEALKLAYSDETSEAAYAPSLAELAAQLYADKQRLEKRIATLRTFLPPCSHIRPCSMTDVEPQFWCVGCRARYLDDKAAAEENQS